MNYLNLKTYSTQQSYNLWVCEVIVSCHFNAICILWNRKFVDLRVPCHSTCCPQGGASAPIKTRTNASYVTYPRALAPPLQAAHALLLWEPDGRERGRRTGRSHVELSFRIRFRSLNPAMSDILMKEMESISIGATLPEESPGGGRSFLLVDEQENLQVKS